MKEFGKVVGGESYKFFNSKQWLRT